MGTLFFASYLSTHAIESFVAYCQANADEDASVYIDPASMKAVGIFDNGSVGAPGWGEHRGILQLTSTAEFSELCRRKNTRMDQEALLDFMIDLRDFLTLFEQNTLNATRTAMEKVGVNSLVAMFPVAFRMSCVPYHGLEPQVFECRLRFVIKDEAATFGYRITAFEAQMESMAGGFQEQLVEDLSGVIERVYLGEFTNRQ